MRSKQQRGKPLPGNGTIDLDRRDENEKWHSKTPTPSRAAPPEQTARPSLKTLGAVTRQVQLFSQPVEDQEDGNREPLLRQGKRPCPSTSSPRKNAEKHAPSEKKPAVEVQSAIRRQVTGYLSRYFPGTVPIEVVDEVLRVFLEEGCDAILRGTQVNPVGGRHHYQDRVNELLAAEFDLTSPAPCYLRRKQFLV